MLPARRFAPLALVSPPSRRAPEPEYLNRPGIISESTRAGSYGTHALRHPLHGPGTASGATWATFGTVAYYFRATSGGSPPQSLAIAKVHPRLPTGADCGQRLAGSMGRDDGGTLGARVAPVGSGPPLLSVQDQVSRSAVPLRSWWRSTTAERDTSPAPRLCTPTPRGQCDGSQGSV